MTTDPVFPFPEPDFLFVHTGTIYSKTSDTIDDRGKAAAVYDAGTEVNCYLTASDPNKEEAVGSERVRYDAVVLLPLGTSIDVTSRFGCSDSQLIQGLGGRFRVLAVRPTLVHIRVLLERFTGVWEET